MSAHRVLAEIGQAALHHKINDPGTSGVMDLAGKSFGVLDLTSAGTRMLPAYAPSGTVILVCNTSGSTISIKDSGDTVGLDVATNKVGIFVSTGSATPATAWVGYVGTSLTS